MSLPVQLALIALWAPPLVLLHELGHAAAALLLTRGPVAAVVGRGRSGPRFVVGGRLGIMFSGWGLTGGYCLHRVSTRRREAAIAAAGPAASLLGGALLLTAAIGTGHPSHGIGRLWLTGAGASLLSTLTELIPYRSARGVSDGAHVYRGLTGRDAAGVATTPERPLRPVYAVVLALAALVAFAVDVRLGIAAVVFFGLAALAERRR